MGELWPAVLLAWIGGFVDALGYLALSHVFTAHMSGNSAAFGAQLGRGDWHEAIVRGLAIPAFVLGVALGVLGEVLARRSRLRGQMAPAFALELLLLLGFLLWDPIPPATSPVAGTFKFFVQVWVLALAMGLQNATLRRAGGARVRTTYVSGMLTNMAEDGMLYLLCQWDRLFGRKESMDPPAQKPLGRRAVMFGLIFLSFLAGGMCGGLGEVQWGSRALLAPIAGLAVLIAEDWISPIPRQLG